MDAQEFLRRYTAYERDFTGVDLRHINLSGANLTDINFTEADLSGADLRGADLSGAVLIETNLSGADLTGTKMNDVLFCRTIMPYGTIKSDPKRVITTEQLLERYAVGERDFPSIVIPHAELRNKDLRGISLFHPKSRVYRAYRPHLPNSNLSGANLEGSFLQRTNFRCSDLSNVNFSDVNLRGANFTDVNLRGANLLRAELEDVKFTRADLTGAEVIEGFWWSTFFHNTILPNGEVIVGPIWNSD